MSHLLAFALITWRRLIGFGLGFRLNFDLRFGGRFDLQFSLRFDGRFQLRGRLRLQSRAYFPARILRFPFAPTRKRSM
jgi:hypothetical protein